MDPIKKADSQRLQEWIQAGTRTVVAVVSNPY